MLLFWTVKHVINSTVNTLRGKRHYNIPVLLQPWEEREARRIISKTPLVPSWAESNREPICTIKRSHRLRYLGVKIYSVCVMAGAELQARVDGMGGAGVISIIALIIVISISSRRQTRRSSPVCRERGRGWLISHRVFIIGSLLAFTALLVPLFAPLVMQRLAETLNSSSFWDLLHRAQYWADMTFVADNSNAYTVCICI